MGGIICGYFGIGKSTLCKRRKDFIDLESSCFYYPDKNHIKLIDWYVGYTNIAMDLAKQGYYVFTSCHYPVRYIFSQAKDIKSVVIMPSVEMRENWEQGLRKRYLNTRSDNDYRAWSHADCLEDDLKSAGEMDIPLILLDKGYDLKGVVYDYFDLGGNK
jgi:hypothetical protein